MTISINLEDLLPYVIGCLFGIILVIWIIKSIIPFGNQTGGGSGGTLLFLLLIAIITPILQDIFSTSIETEVWEDEKSQNESDSINNVIPEEIFEADALTINNTSKADVFLDAPHPVAHYVQISSGYNEEAARELAKEHKDKISRVARKNDRFIVVVGRDFETEIAARRFINSYKSDLPEGAFRIDSSETQLYFLNKNLITI